MGGILRSQESLVDCFNNNACENSNFELILCDFMLETAFHDINDLRLCWYTLVSRDCRYLKTKL